jgi:phosphoribosyl 1,2-cyclic phosphodiesterase
LLRFASLASGSRGNCLVAEAGGTRVMVDCGLALRDAERRLARLGLVPADITAILITHEHSDHACGAFEFAAAHGCPVYLTHGTLRALRDEGKVREGVAIHIVSGRDAVALDGIEVRPFTVPHDAREPVQFVLSDGAFRLGVLTDLGTSTPHVEHTLSGCDALVLECNHDAGLLRGGGYPGWLKMRIGGPFGHLENSVSAALLAALDRSRLKHVIGAHLSRENNRPELARAALARALGCEERAIDLATQEGGFDWREA